MCPRFCASFWCYVLGSPAQLVAFASEALLRIHAQMEKKLMEEIASTRVLAPPKFLDAACAVQTE